MPISEELLEKFRIVSSELLEKLRAHESLAVKKVEWISVDGLNPVPTAAVDSSRQYEIYRGFIVYAIQGHAISISLEKRSTVSFQNAEAGYLDVVEASRIGVRNARESLLSSVSKTLEVRLLSKVVESSGARLALLDGSYESFLGPILVFVGELRKAAPNLAGRIRNLWEDRVKLFNELTGTTRLAFISKSSSKLNLVEEGKVEVELEGLKVKVPDFIVVKRVLTDLNPVKPGFLWYPNPYMELRKGGDEVSKLADKLSRWYTLTYILLHPRGRVYQLTIPGKLSKEEVAEIVEQLIPISPGGYPEPLAIAHHLSYLRRSEFRKLVAHILPQLETGREFLEYTIS